VIASALGVAGCPEPEADDPFHVTFSFPADGEEVFPETPVRLGFSEAIDPDTCGRPSWYIAALGETGVVAWFEEFTIEDMAEEAHSYELIHDGLTPGLVHAVTVQGGSSGCTSAAGEAIAPFTATFSVVERPDPD
jgi:hypothetical protein